MGSLLSGTTNPDSPIRPLHASFHDFLTDKAFNEEFFIDLSKTQHDLAFASLRVMEHGLRFNICDLKSSYLPNREDPGLQERVQKCIPQHLSYSSRFWTSHVRTISFDKELAKEVKLFFDNERLFFWLELLALINALSGTVPALPPIAQWLKPAAPSATSASAAPNSTSAPSPSTLSTASNTFPDTWKIRNDKALGIIIEYVSNEKLDLIADETSAKGAWEKLERVHQGTNPGLIAFFTLKSMMKHTFQSYDTV
ncbi:hypothetical protein F4604DRAFT_2022318 [Suillus subluteus]|nr:hypothetical protein F4604DRAFT_2022318 [Suillus subluteus]